MPMGSNSPRETTLGNELPNVPIQFDGPSTSKVIATFGPLSPVVISFDATCGRPSAQLYLVLLGQLLDLCLPCLDRGEVGAVDQASACLVVARLHPALEVLPGEHCGHIAERVKRFVR